MTTTSLTDDMNPERRGSDEHTRQIVHLTVAEIFDGVGVDFTTPEGRARFRNNLAFLDDAVGGTKAIKRTFWGGLATVGGIGIYKLWPAIALWLAR